MNSWKWFAGAATSSLAPLIPAVGDPLAWRATRIAGAFGKGASKLHPLGVAFGALQVAHMTYTNRHMLYREGGDLGARNLEILTGGRYEAPSSAWENTPKQRIAARRTHGWFVSPADRMRRNPPMMSSREVAQRDFQRYS
jgi:hypothetical protein